MCSSDLTRPAVASVLAGYDTPEHVEQAVAYETAGEAEKDYASVLARAPRHTFGQGGVHLLRPLPSLPGAYRHCHGK